LVRRKESVTGQARETDQHDRLLNLQRAAGNQGVLQLLNVGQTNAHHEQEADHIAEGLVANGNESAQAQTEADLGIEPGSVRLHTGPRAENAARALNARAFTVGNDIVFGRNEYSPASSEGQRLLTHELVHVAQQQHESQAGSTLMRKVKIPTAEELESEIASLRIRLAELIQEETEEGKSTAERATVEGRLAWLEGVAAENDPDKQKIIYLRERIRQLRDDIKAAPPSSAKEEIGIDIQEHELELTKALEANVANIESQLSDLYTTVDLTPALNAQILALENELRENEAELKILRRIFSPAKAETVRQTYKKEVRPDMSGHCMGAVYKGMEAIYSPKVSSDIEAQVRKDSREILKKTKKDTNNVDRIMETLREHSLAGEKIPIKYNLSKKVWVPTVEETVLGMVKGDYPGWYFFGLSVSGGYHSVILAVDNSEGTPKIYWLDQNTKGFTKEVTGKLDKKMKEDWLHPSYGFSDSTVWPLLPTADAVVEIP
jgi:hypothetical protein